MQYTEKELAKLIEDVEKEFTAHLAKAEEVTLAKSEDGEKDHKEDNKEEKKDEPEHKEAPQHEAKEEKPEAHAEGEKHDEKPMAENHDEEGHDYDQEDLEHMEKMYRSMSKGEIKAHHDCVVKCMGKAEAKPAEMSKNEAEGHKNGGEISACEPKDVPGAKSEASDAHGDKMDKSEKTEVELLKSELDAKKAEHDELKKNFEAVQEFLTVLSKKTAPQGKAITSLDVIAKSETSVEEKPLTKSEIHEKLKEKSSNPTLLKKSDRDAITSYYLTGQVNVNSISHLLK